MEWPLQSNKFTFLMGRGHNARKMIKMPERERIARNNILKKTSEHSEHSEHDTGKRTRRGCPNRSVWHSQDQTHLSESTCIHRSNQRPRWNWAQHWIHRPLSVLLEALLRSVASICLKLHSDTLKDTCIYIYMFICVYNHYYHDSKLWVALLLFYLRRGDESQELVGTGRREWRGWEGFRRWWRRRQCEAILSAVLESVGRGKECAGDLTYYTWHSICGILHSTLDWFDVRLYSLYYRIDRPTFHTVQVTFYIPGSSLHTWHSTGTGNNGIF